MKDYFLKECSTIISCLFFQAGNYSESFAGIILILSIFKQFLNGLLIQNVRICNALDKPVGLILYFSMNLFSPHLNTCSCKAPRTNRISGCIGLLDIYSGRFSVSSVAIHLLVLSVSLGKYIIFGYHFVNN